MEKLAKFSRRPVARGEHLPAPARSPQRGPDDGAVLRFMIGSYFSGGCSIPCSEELGTSQHMLLSKCQWDITNFLAQAEAICWEGVMC